MTLTPGRIFGYFFLIFAVLICITIVARYRATGTMVPTQGRLSAASEAGQSAIYYVHGRLGSSSANSYNITVSYEYRVKGVMYRGKNISLNGNAYTSEKEVKKLVQKYLTSGTVTVWYDPAAPEFAVLEKPELDGDLWVWLVSCLALAVVSFHSLDGIVMRLSTANR